VENTLIEIEFLKKHSPQFQIYIKHYISLSLLYPPFFFSPYAQYGVYFLPPHPKAPPLQRRAHLPQKGHRDLCQVTANKVKVPQVNGKAIKDHQDHQETPKGIFLFQQGTKARRH
jgi:hypothetical protein